MTVSVTNQRTGRKHPHMLLSNFNRLSKVTFKNKAGQIVPTFVLNGDVPTEAKTPTPVAPQKKSPVAPVKRQAADSEIKIIAQKIEEIERAETIEQVDEIIKGQQNFNVLITGERKKNEFLVIAVAKAYDEMAALHNGMTALTETNNALSQKIQSLTKSDNKSQSKTNE